MEKFTILYKIHYLFFYKIHYLLNEIDYFFTKSTIFFYEIYYLLDIEDGIQYKHELYLILKILLDELLILNCFRDFSKEARRHVTCIKFVFNTYDKGIRLYILSL